jgi:hypothetical protein
MAKKPTWLDAHHGWGAGGNVVETYWLGDPAVDIEKSDVPAYLRTLDIAALAIRPGETPVRLLVTLPTPTQWAEISSHLSRDFAEHQRAAIKAMTAAVELCVRFPDDEGAAPVYLHGFERLSPGLMRFLQREQPGLIPALGGWLISKYALTDDEKKASSLDVGPKTSSPAEPTTATTATPDGSDSRVVLMSPVPGPQPPAG